MAKQTDAAKDLRLTIELVPRTCWYNNMRAALSPQQWNTLRESVYMQQRYRCGICAATGTLHCHEQWHYDDERHQQTLHGFIALCEWCHHVKHIGLADVLARKGKLEFARVIEHFLRVNRCSRETFETHSHAAFVLWRERSRFQWETDLGAYSSLVAHASMKKAVSKREVRSEANE